MIKEIPWAAHGWCSYYDGHTEWAARARRLQGEIIIECVAVGHCPPHNLFTLGACERALEKRGVVAARLGPRAEWWDGYSWYDVPRAIVVAELMTFIQGAPAAPGNGQMKGRNEKGK